MLTAMGAKHFGIHAFLASNTLSNDYYPALARILFQLAVELQGGDRRATSPSSTSPAAWAFPTVPDQPANDIAAIGEGVRAGL